mmetsp:Transcript_17126/g.33544  ORF Transcript_17126/g.33544 Transcript_17126/m.33544 type:complete len:98 (+) Transcript_17126:122-415(+)
MNYKVRQRPLSNDIYWVSWEIEEAGEGDEDKDEDEDEDDSEGSEMSIKPRHTFTVIFESLSSSPQHLEIADPKPALSREPEQWTSLISIRTSYIRRP